MQIDATKLYKATITTPRGTIVVCLQPSLAPNTVNNFVRLARNHYYDGIPFHRVCPNPADTSCGGTLAIIQGGDPKCIASVHAPTCGQGGPGYRFKDEPVHQQYLAGTVAMANSGPNTNGSQFFINTGANQFPPSYNLFGTLASGLDVAKAIVQGDVMQTVTVAQQQ
ncbi:MAG: peptidylprolyl isomerase [Candidatus Dormibacteraeota bacterium]|uniref:Peptidyl-prolyl cis-trans isomerase n=1 Tax=Candidatus Amunia macphersoniae TaxID=3127014 RepID=A0A934KPQ9_9BACT|nr:peptidylprolyl isomerase [Candidatus Dormibacteraeota bacterium]